VGGRGRRRRCGSGEVEVGAEREIAAVSEQRTRHGDRRRGCCKVVCDDGQAAEPLPAAYVRRKGSSRRRTGERGRAHSCTAIGPTPENSIYDACLSPRRREQDRNPECLSGERQPDEGTAKSTSPRSASLGRSRGSCVLHRLDRSRVSESARSVRTAMREDAPAEEPGRPSQTRRPALEGDTESARRTTL